MQDQELTGWFELSDQEPWEPGVYDVELGIVEHGKLISGIRQFSEWKSYWDGYCFKSASDSVERAFINRYINESTGLRVVKWRGLASDPSAKPKPKRSGNPKVTRYVVIAVGSEKTVATFKGETAALDYAEIVNFQVRVKKIRFRSPE